MIARLRVSLLALALLAPLACNAPADTPAEAPEATEPGVGGAPEADEAGGPAAGRTEQVVAEGEETAAPEEAPTIADNGSASATETDTAIRRGSDIVNPFDQNRTPARSAPEDATAIATSTPAPPPSPEPEAQAAYDPAPSRDAVVTRSEDSGGTQGGARYEVQAFGSLNGSTGRGGGGDGFGAEGLVGGDRADNDGDDDARDRDQDRSRTSRPSRRNEEEEAGEREQALAPTETQTGFVATIPDANEPPQPSQIDILSRLRAIGNTNINLGGSQDIGLFRRRLDDGQVPADGEFDASGFFAEHHTPLPVPDCGQVVCVQAMLGVLPDLSDGEPVTMLQVGLNSPIEADPSLRPPLTLSVVIDTSGSMQSAGKIDFVRTGLERLVDRMQDGDQIAIITYDNNAETVFPMASVAQNRVELRRLIRDLQANGGTNLYAGLEMGYREVMSHYDSGRQNRVILLSDGQPTAGVTSTPRIEEMSRTFNSDGVGLTTIGLGSSFNVDLMSGLAQQGDGNFYFVEDAGAVEEVFSDEISYFTVPVAFDLEVAVEMGDMYEIVDAYGAPDWEGDTHRGRLEQPSVFLAHRVSHADVTESGGRRGGGSALILALRPRTDGTVDPNATHADIANITLSFREPGSDRTVTQNASVVYPNNPSYLPPTGYFQATDLSIVQKSFVMLNLYTAIETAVEEFHAGQRSDAVGRLRRVIAAARDFEDSANGGTGDTDIRLDVELVEQLIQVMRRNGAPEPTLVAIPNDPWPVDRDG